LRFWRAGLVPGFLSALLLGAPLVTYTDSRSSAPAVSQPGVTSPEGASATGAPAGPARRPEVVPVTPAVPGGPRPDLVLLFAGEVTGWTEPCG